MRFFYYPIFILLITLYSCKKQKNTDTDNPQQPIDTVSVSGSISLPVGSQVNLNGWSVNSGFSRSSVTNNKYKLEKADKSFNMVFVSDQNGNERLIGLFYKGQKDFTINSATTITAMLMKMPFVASLSDSGQLLLMKSIQSNASFPDVVNEFEKAFLQNKLLFDSSNSILNTKLINLYNQVTKRGTGTAVDQNINFIRANRTIAFQNPGWSFSQMIGIYKDGVLIKSMPLDRYQFFAGSVLELINLIKNPQNPIEQIYTMEGDGKFEFKVRTGLPFSGLLNDPLAYQAFVDNYTNVVMDQISFVARNFPWINFNNDCIKEMKSYATGQVSAFNSIVSQNNGDVRSSSSVILQQVIQSTIELAASSSNCVSSDEGKGFLKNIKNLLKFLDVVSKTSQVLNAYTFVEQITRVPAAFDTCLLASGNVISPCWDVNDYSIELYLDSFAFKSPGGGDVYPLVDKVIKAGDLVNVYMGGLSPYARVKYKNSIISFGVIVNGTPVASSYLNLVDPQNNTTLVFGPNDYTLDNNFIRFYDLTNNRQVSLPVKLKISNLLYRTIVGKTITVDHSPYYPVIYINLNSTTNTNQAYIVGNWTDNNNNSGTYSTQASNPGGKYYRNCAAWQNNAGSSDVTNKRQIGAISFNNYANYPFPTVLWILEDGTVEYRCGIKYSL